MKKFLSNAFSLQMINTSEESSLTVIPVTAMEVAESGAESVIGHQDTAAVVSALLGVPVTMNRVSVTLCQGDVLYVAQVTGGRLPEGATTLPEGLTIKFLKVTLN